MIKKHIVIIVIFLMSAISSQVLTQDCVRAAKISNDAIPLISSRPIEAANKLREAITYCDKSATLYYNLGLALYDQKRYDEGNL